MVDIERSVPLLAKVVHLLAAAGLPPLPVTALPAADDEHRGIHMRRWQERAPWQHEADGQGEPSRVARSEFTYEGSLQHEIGRDKPAVGCQQRPQQAGRNPVRRVRHNPERPAGQPDRGGVRVHHGNARESLAEDTDSSRVQLHGDHPRPRSH